MSWVGVVSVLNPGETMMTELWKKRSVGWVLAGILGAGGMLPGWAEPGRVAQETRQGQFMAQNQGNEAQHLIDEGMKLFQQGSKESLERALIKFTAAIRVSQAANDKPRTALALLANGLMSDRLGDKSKALDFYNQALIIWRVLGERSGEASTLSNIGVVYDALGEKQKALEYYNQALPLMRAVGDRLREATTLNNIGKVYSNLGEQQKALEYYNQVLSLRRSVGDRSGEATTLNNIGAVYSALGEQQKALNYYTQSLPLRRAVGDRSGESTTLSNIGGVYSNLGEKQKALDYYNQALLLNRVIGDRFNEASILSNIGSIYSALGEKQRALEFFNQSLPIRHAMGDRNGEAITLSNIGSIYDDLGEKQKALEFFNQSLPLMRAVGDRGGEATTLNNIGGVYNVLGEKQKALDYYTQSLHLGRTVGDRSGEATRLTNIGAVYDDLGEKQKALEFYSQSLMLMRAVGDRSGEATTLTNIGVVYNAIGEKQKALEFFNQALPLRRAVGDRSGEAGTLVNIGVVYNAIGEKQKALELFNQALPLTRAVDDRSSEFKLLGNIATIYRTQNRLPESLTQINTAITLIEQLRSNIQDPNLKTSYFTTVQDYYQLKIDLLMQLHQQDPSQRYDIQAFETSDQQRARTLRDLLTEANANIRKNITPELKAQETDLQTKLIAREKQLIELSGKANSDKVIQQLQQEIQTLLRQQQDLAQQIRRTNPDYAKLQYPTPITLPQIQQQLQPDTLLLQYSLGKDASYLWAVTKTTLNTYKLPKKIDLETTVQAFRTSLLDANDSDIGTPAQTLTQQIIGPIANQLGQKRLLIVPDGVLHKIPFVALAQLGQKDYKPLLTTHEITYLPAAALIFPQHPDRPLAPKTIALLADPIFSPKDDRLPRKTTPTKQPELTETIARDRAARSLNLSRLPGTAIEAKAIASLVPESQRTIVTGFDSNYPWVTSPKLNQYRYLHLATHGIFDQERPELSSLILSLYNPNGDPQKGFLRLPDLFNLDLPTEMVTLSACQTGLGNSIPGEGLVGMTRGLIYAGAKRVTVSLWDVPDAETAELMQRFYRSLFDRTTPISHSAALRSAQLHLWNQGRHPYYWAAFGLQGEWRN